MSSETLINLTFELERQKTANKRLRKRIAELEAVIVSLNEIYPKRIAELEAENNIWQNQDLLEQCNRQAEHIAELKAELKAGAELCKFLATLVEKDD